MLVLLLHPTLFRTLSLVPAEEEEKSLLGKLLQPLTGKSRNHTYPNPDPFCGRMSRGKGEEGTPRFKMSFLLNWWEGSSVWGRHPRMKSTN
jgi:hypothetical protein